MMKSLNSMNSLRVPLIKNSLLQLPLDAPPTSCHTPSPLHGYSILDVGCGAGFLSEVGDTLVQWLFGCLLSSSPPLLAASGQAGCRGHWAGAL